MSLQQQHQRIKLNPDLEQAIALPIRPQPLDHQHEQPPEAPDSQPLAQIQLAAEPLGPTPQNLRNVRRATRRLRDIPPQEVRHSIRTTNNPAHLDDYDLTIYDNIDICYVETTDPTTDKITYKEA